MSAKRQLRRRSTEDKPRFVIGMDAHSKRKMRRDAADFTNRLTEREGRK
jgi:hypothetical protein